MGKCVWVGQSKSLVSKQIIVAAFSVQIICFPYRKARSVVTDWCICSPLLQGKDPEWRWLAKYNEDTGWGGSVTCHADTMQVCTSRGGTIATGAFLGTSSIWAKAGREQWLHAVRALSWNTLGAVLLTQHPLVFVSEQLLRGCQSTWPHPHLWECCWNAALRAGEHSLEVECQGSMGFWIPNPTGYTERDHSEIFLVLEEVISCRAIKF